MKGQLFISDCGGYYARDLGGCNFEVWTSNGCIHYRDENQMCIRDRGKIINRII